MRELILIAAFTTTLMTFDFGFDPVHAQNGISVSIGPGEAQIVLREPLLVALSVKNDLSETVHFDLGLNRTAVIEFSVTGPDGKTIHLRRPTQDGFGRLGKISLAPGKTYIQSLLLNEWYQLPAPGSYRIGAVLETSFLADTGSIIKPAVSGTMLLTVLGPDEARLRNVCQRLTESALMADSLDARSQAALTLSYVQDPIAVPFLRQILTGGKLVQHYAAEGLGRVGSDEAADALLASLTIRDPEVRPAILSALRQIEKSSHDQELRTRIESALSRTGGKN